MAILEQEQKELQLLAVQHDMWKAGEISLASNDLEPASVVDGSPMHRASAVLPFHSKEATLEISRIQGDVNGRAAQVSQRRSAGSAGRHIRSKDKYKEGPKIASSKTSDIVVQDTSKNPRFQRHQRIDKRKQVMKALAYNAFMKQASIKSRAQEQRRNDEALTDVGGFDWNMMAQQPTIRKDPAMMALGRESDKIDDVYDPTEDPQNIGPGDSEKDGKGVEWWSEDSLKGAKLNDQWWQHGGEDGMTG